MVRPWPAAAPEPLQTMAALVCICGRRGPTIANYGCLGIHLWSTRAFRSSKTLLAKGVSLLSTSDCRKSVNVVGFWVSGFRVLPRVVGEALPVPNNAPCAHNLHSLDPRPKIFNQTTGLQSACLRRARTSHRRKRRGSKSSDRRL